MNLLYGLDAEEEGSIALNLLPLVMGVGGSGEGVKGEGVRGMAARFHLLRVCEQAVNKSLEGIDALLGEYSLPGLKIRLDVKQHLLCLPHHQSYFCC